MAKNLSFTVLLLVLVVASTGFLKSEAIDCPDGCPTTAECVFLDECGPLPFTGTDIDCCKGLYASHPLYWAMVEGTNPKHCHCYKKKV